MSRNVTFRVFRRAYTSRAASALGRVREEADRLAARDARAALDFTYSELERELWKGELAEVELRLKVELTWERPETTLTLQMAQWRMMTIVCRDVSTEPILQPLSGETSPAASTITTSGARLDIAASGFYGGRFELALMSVCLTPWQAQIALPLPAATVVTRLKSGANMVCEYTTSSKCMHLW